MYQLVNYTSIRLWTNQAFLVIHRHWCHEIMRYMYMKAKTQIDVFGKPHHFLKGMQLKCIRLTKFYIPNSFAYYCKERGRDFFHKYSALIGIYIKFTYQPFCDTFRSWRQNPIGNVYLTESFATKTGLQLEKKIHVPVLFSILFIFKNIASYMGTKEKYLHKNIGRRDKLEV